MRFAVGVASGTDALHLALRACGIGRGDEVITTPFTFASTAETISYLDAIPVFVDIDPNTYNIDSQRIREKITERTRAILPVHLFGHPAEMDEIVKIAEEYGLRVIEDCAQAFGAVYKGRKIGTFGDAGCFSFFPSKNLGCYGDGGMVITDDEEIYSEVKRLRNHGSTKKYHHSVIGFNSRLDEIQAGILRVKLKRVDEYNRLRRKNASIYSDYLEGLPITVPAEMEGCYHVYNHYTIRTQSESQESKVKNKNLRDILSESLSRESIASAIYYPLSLHLQEAFRFLGYKNGDLLESERASTEVISLPMFPELTEEQIETICNCIREALPLTTIGGKKN